MQFSGRSYAVVGVCATVVGMGASPTVAQCVSAQPGLGRASNQTSVKKGGTR